VTATLARRAAALAITVGALLLWAAPAAAHGAVVLTVHGDGRGAVWVTAVWADGHPITEPVGALLTASAANGQRVGPVALKQQGDRLAYPGTLAPGAWTVVAEMGEPAIGRCDALVRVADPGGSPQPTELRCGASAPVAEPPPVPAPSGSSGIPWYLGMGATVVIIAAGVWGLRGRRPAPVPVRGRAGSGTRGGA
jgi:hypothetical protein